ncbi:MAG: prepilin-type N-terminal cleavage/methylation domain-containing protein [Candidatus Hydrogenedentes bacterium]|nr:prepilin-type N-terminal cleavage/methylation domain-containing protein [Candidatus Hydrogenedentota bacterium]
MGQWYGLTHQREGFTLIELLIVISIITIIIGIAVPLMLRTRMNVNETAAVGCVRTISTAEQAFRSAIILDADGNGDGDYGALQDLANPSTGQQAPFIDPSLGSGAKHGYSFTIAVTPGTATQTPAYECLAVPTSPGRTGVRQFFVDESSIIRFTADGSAPSVSSTPIG